MKRKLISIILTLVICMGFAVPTLAAGEAGETLTFMSEYYEGRYGIAVSNAVLSDETFMLPRGYKDGRPEYEEVVVYYVVDGVSVLTLLVDSPEYAPPQGTYINGLGTRTNWETGEEFIWTLAPPIIIYASISFPEGVPEYYSNYPFDEFLFDDSMFDLFGWRTDNIETFFCISINDRIVFKLVDELPSQAATPQTPASPASQTVNPTPSTVIVNGMATAFEAYLIDGYNYFKLRDLAFALNGSSKQFAVGWDGEADAISLTSGGAYETVGGEMEQGDGEAKTANPTTSRVFLDGQELSLTAYNIGGNNFFRLRDLMSALDIGVTWDDATSTIGIDTSISYVD